MAGLAVVKSHHQQRAGQQDLRRPIPRVRKVSGRAYFDVGTNRSRFIQYSVLFKPFYSIFRYLHFIAMELAGERRGRRVLAHLFDPLHARHAGWGHGRRG
eukprot:9101228-Pyramimonas_sp.AAC.2